MIPDEREWQAQERAMQIERQAQDMADADSLAASYISIAKALRQPMQSGLAPDFARRVAARAAAQVRPVVVESRLEQRLTTLLATIMAMSGFLVLLIYRDEWLTPMIDMLGRMGKFDSPWPVAMLLCLAVSWLAQQLRRQAQSGTRHLA